jgi:anti-sigma factor RsiW
VNCNTTEDLLHAFADGELDPANHLPIEEHLKTCPACERIVKDITSVKSAMSDSSLYFAAPPGLRQRIKSALPVDKSHPAQRIWQLHWIPVLAAAVAIAIFVFLLLPHGSSNDDLLAKEVVSGHVRSMMANHLTDVPSSDQHTVKPWFEGKLDYSPPVIDLASSGFPLVGGRLDYVGSRPVAALVYQRRQHFINLFVFPSAGNSDATSKMSVQQGYNVIRWNRSGMSFWAVSDVNLNDLQEFAQGIQN